MRRKTLALLVGLVLLSLPVAQLRADEGPVLTLQVFHLKYISAGEAAAAVEGLLSSEGSITLKPASNSLTVQDRADVVAKIAKRITSIDRRPIRFRLRVEVLKGSDAEYSVPALAEVTARLKEFYPFTSYQRIGTAEFAGEAGDSGTLDIGDNYRIHLTVNEQRLDNLPFGLPEAGVRLIVDPIVLERQLSATKVRTIAQGRAALSADQEGYIGAGSSEKGTSGLVIIVTALSVTEG